MSSKRKIDASRRNGARSRGPKTEAGKRRSSQNAIRHGLLAQRVVLDGESEEHFQMLLSQYLEKFDPADGPEFGMVEEMVSSYWRYHRGLMIEKGLFDQALAKQEHFKDEVDRHANAWRMLADTPEFKNLLRYQSIIHRTHQRALNSFLVLNEIGPDDTPEQNEPNPISGHSQQVAQAVSPAAEPNPVAPAPAESTVPACSTAPKSAPPSQSQPECKPERESVALTAQPNSLQPVLPSVNQRTDAVPINNGI